MGRDFAEKFPEARAVYDRANAILGFDLAKLCFEGPEERLNQTDMSQPAIYVTSLACFAALKAQGKIPETDLTFAGLSLGEYTALHLAGVFSFEDGLKLVAARGKYMQEAAVATPSTMVAVLGAEEAQVEQLCKDAAQGEVLVPANFNAPGQIVVSGTKPACERFIAAATTAGIKCIPLTVAGAFHSPIMQSGADRMKAELERVEFKSPAARVFSNVTALPHTSPDSIKALLVEQIVKSVKWAQTLQPFANEPGIKFIELAPGKTLTGLLKKQNRRADVDNHATAGE
jgi:[acyl-carrier-protein] S-malonyltransferase